MDPYLGKLPDLAMAALGLWAQWRLCGWIRGAGKGRLLNRVIGIWFWLGSALLLTPFLWLPMTWDRYLRQIPTMMLIRGAAYAWAIAVTGSLAVVVLFLVVARLARRGDKAPAFDPARRRLFRIARAGAVVAPLGAVGFGIIVERSHFELTEVDVEIPDLPPDLDGLRLVQLSDIHLSPYLSERELDRTVDMANETRADLALVTGDLITVSGELLSRSLDRLGRLRADSGVYGCLGNHEMIAGCSQRTKTEGAAVGLDFLRGEARQLRFGDATLNLAGVDYQRCRRRYLREAEPLKRPNAVNLLLSHNPDVFDTAAEQGWDLTLAGHTHGGQITAGVMSQYLNPARFITPYVYGLYRQGDSSIYVNSGIGTVGIPLRFGAPPEVALIRLCVT